MQQPRANTQAPRLADQQLSVQMFLQKKNKKSEGAVFEGFGADVEIATAAFHVAFTLFLPLCGLFQFSDLQAEQ